MKIPQETLEILSALEVDFDRVRIRQQLDRKSYLAVDKVLQAMGGKWDRRAKAHVFAGDARERIDQAIVTGDVEMPRVDLDYFPTPRDLARRVAMAADVRPGHSVLEPSAGGGALVRAALELGARVVFAVEISGTFASQLRERFEIEVESSGPPYVIVEHRDFTEFPPPFGHSVDRVVMNPPFSGRRDVKHIRLALEWLKPGGKLAAVASAGVAFREDKLGREFRELVASCGGSIEPLPAGSFKPSGTDANTVLVTMTRPR